MGSLIKYYPPIVFRRSDGWAKLHSSDSSQATAWNSWRRLCHAVPPLPEFSRPKSLLGPWLLESMGGSSRWESRAGVAPLISFQGYLIYFLVLWICAFMNSRGGKTIKHPMEPSCSISNSFNGLPENGASFCRLTTWRANIYWA